jgi:hypothetical protein
MNLPGSSINLEDSLEWFYAQRIQCLERVNRTLQDDNPTRYNNALNRLDRIEQQIETIEDSIIIMAISRNQNQVDS